MSQDYKNELKLSAEAYGVERRRNLAKEVLKDGSPFPQPLEYKDIDDEFKHWVETSLDMTYDGKKLPTILLFSNQRFSEYMQSWANVDDKKNFIMNFKAITRENNPKGGTLYGSTRNIPGERTYLMKRVEARDKNDRKYYIDYRVKQPFCVDLLYTISLVTNKYELLNCFNQLVNDRFKAIDAYIRPNGHYIGMKLTDISDESDYSIDDRRFYSQSYRITVMAYIMPPDSFIVEEKPALMLKGFDGEGKKSFAEIEEVGQSACIGYNPYRYANLKLTVGMDTCTKNMKFNMDTNFRIDKVKMTNVRGFEFWLNNDKENKQYVNGEIGESESDSLKGFEIKADDTVHIAKLSRYYSTKEAKVVFEGIDWTDIYDTRETDEKLNEIEY